MNFYAASALTALLFTVAISLLVWRKAIDRNLGRLFVFVNIAICAWILGCFGESYAAGRWALASDKVLYTGACFAPVLFLHFALNFSNRLERFRKFLFLNYAVSTTFELINLIPSLRRYFIPFVAHRYFYRYIAEPGFLWYVFSACYLVPVLGLLAILFHGYRTTPSGNKRNQFLYFFIAATILVIGGALYFGLVYSIRVPPVDNFFTIGYGLLMAYAMIKHQLMDIRVAIRKTLIYSVVSAALASIYVGTITLLAHILQGRQGSVSAYSSALAAVCITLLFNPLRTRLQAFIDKKFARSKLVGGEQLMKFSAEVIGHERLEKITHSMGRILDEAVHPEIWALYLRTSDDKEYVKLASASAGSWPDHMSLTNVWSNYFLAHPGLATSPMPPGTQSFDLAVAVPLLGGRDLLGYMLLGRKQSEEAYSEEDLILLRLIANQAVVAFERPKMARQISSAFVHEVKMPLANISLPAELTFMELEDAERGTRNINELIVGMKRRMKYIMEQAAIAGKRVDAVRDFSEDELVLKDRVPLASVIQSSLASLDALFRENRIQTHLSLNDAGTVAGDARQLEILFVNLILNAIEAMADLPAERPREIHVEETSEEGCVMIRIRDTGIGVPPEDRERIFQPNYSTKGSNGAGMGLFLCRQIIQAHGGAIDVIDHDGLGTTFLVKLLKTCMSL